MAQTRQRDDTEVRKGADNDDAVHEVDEGDESVFDLIQQLSPKKAKDDDDDGGDVEKQSADLAVAELCRSLLSRQTMTAEDIRDLHAFIRDRKRKEKNPESEVNK